MRPHLALPASAVPCANIMNGQFVLMGVAFAVNECSELCIYGAQEFAQPQRAP